MSDQDSPVGLLFEMQREAIKQTEDVIGNLIDISTDVGESVTDGVQTHREVQERTLELTRDSMHQSLDAAETVTANPPSVEGVPDPTTNLDDLRETVDSTFDSILEQHDQAFDTVDEQYEGVSDDALTNLETQIELLVEANERIETQLFDSVERFVEQAEATDGLSAGVEDQLERLAAQFESQATRFDDLEDQFETIDIGASE